MSARWISCADTAKLIRAALKQEWPAVKFSVRSSTYSGGASIDIKWTDGPTEPMVERITGKYRGASFDGMIDLKSYHDSTLNGEAVHFGADYVHCTREYSQGVYETIARRVAKYWGAEFPGVVVKSWGYQLERDPWIDNNPLTTLIYREIRNVFVTTAGALVKVEVK